MRHPADGSDLGVVDHENVGAAYLERLGFPPLAVSVVRQHVNAKRFLVHQRGDAYLRKLSEASLGTLQLQGGPMSDDEAAAFVALPGHEWFVQMRLWEEAAKAQHPFREDPLPPGVTVDTRPGRDATFEAAVRLCLDLGPTQPATTDTAI